MQSEGKGHSLFSRLFVNCLFGARLQAVRKNDDPSGSKLPTAPYQSRLPRAKKQQALPLCVVFLSSSLLLLCFALFRLEHAGA